jgi:hypothetical protein
MGQHHMYPHKCIYPSIHIYIHPYVHTISKNVYIYMYIYINIPGICWLCWSGSAPRIHMYTYIYVYIYIYMHPYIHTYIDIFTYIYPYIYVYIYICTRYLLALLQWVSIVCIPPYDEHGPRNGDP